MRGEKAEKELIKKIYIEQVRSKGLDKEAVLSLGGNEALSLMEKRNGKYWLNESARKKIKVVVTGGVFDIIHVGHVKTLEAAKKLGDVLVVVVARDKYIRKKGREPYHTLEERVELVNSIKPVDIAVRGAENIMESVELTKPDVVVFGYDQKPFTIEGAEIVQLNERHRPERIKTSKMIR
ncbi:MAG: cytidyltransferase, partial [Methanobacteriota archaeon]